MAINWDKLYNDIENDTVKSTGKAYDGGFQEQYEQALKEYNEQQKLINYDTKTGYNELKRLEGMYTAANRIGNNRQLNGREIAATYGAYTEGYSGNADQYARQHGFKSFNDLQDRYLKAKQFHNTATNFQTQKKYMDELEYAQKTQDASGFINRGKKANNNVLNEHRQDDGSSLFTDYNGATLLNVTADEANTYDYLLGKYGTEKAGEYLNSIREQARYRTAERQARKLKGKTALELLSGVDAGLDQFYSGIANIFDDSDYIPSTAEQMRSEMVRKDLAGKGPNILGSSIGQGAYDLITTGANMIPSIGTSMVVGTVNPVAGAAIGDVLMGASAAGGAYQEMLNQGYTKQQAGTYAAINGAMEAGLQYALGGIGKLGGAMSRGALKEAVEGIDKAALRFAVKYGGEMGSEGLEESLQEILDPIIKNAIFNTDEKIDWEQVAYNGLMGALNAGVMNGATGVTENVANRYAENSTYEHMSDAAKRAVITEAQEIDPTNKRANKAAAKINSGKDVSGNTLRKISKASEKTLTEQDIKTITEAAQTQLEGYGETENVDVVARAAAKKTAGKDLSIKESRALKNSKYGQRVLNELNAENIISGDYNTEWTQKIETNRVNAEVYGKILERAQQQAETESNETAYPAVETAQSASESVTENAAVNSADDTNVGTNESDAELAEAAKKYSGHEKAFVHIYNMADSGDVKLFDNAFSQAYDYGKRGIKFSAIENSSGLDVLTKPQIRAAYQAGTKVRTEENSNGREKISDDSGKRNAGVDTRVEGGSMAEGTGAAESRGYGSTQKERAAKIRAAAKTAKSVSTKDLGIEGGTSEKSLHYVEPDAVLKAIESRYPSLNFVWVDGNMKLKDGGQARGAIINGKTVIINAAHPSLSAEQIVKHEYYHSLGKRHNKMLAERAEELYGKEWREYLSDAYAEAYGGLSAEDILDEIFADAYAGIDVLKQRDNVQARATDMSDLVTEAVQSDEAATPLRTDEAVGDSGGEMLSKEFNGKEFAWIENSGMTNKQLGNADDVANYIAQHIGEVYTIVESGSKVYIGKDLPNEYVHSRYSVFIKKHVPSVSKAKNKAVDGLGEMIEIATNRRWEKTKHPKAKDAKYGIYRYSSAFAFPVKDRAGNITDVKAYDVELLICNASDGKKYLYDIVNIKRNTSAELNLLNKEVKKSNYKAATRQSASVNNISPDEEKSKTEFSKGLEEAPREIEESYLENIGTEGYTQFSKEVTDEDTLDFLNKQKTIKTYKSMQLVDGKLYPPMAAVVAGKYEDASVLGHWEQAEEHPELIKVDKKSGKPKFNLNKGKGQGSVAAAYNPYMHSSNLVLNDQFTAAYKRNLVTVECEIPVSELTSGYKAQYAKNAVGMMSWHAGPVASSLPKSKARMVYLTRWIKPVRIVPDAEVAQMYADLLLDDGIAVPNNTVTPSLLAELEKVGVKIDYSGIDKLENRGKTKFSLDTPVEQTDRFVALHNKSATGVMRMLKRGGVPFPSIAIKKAGTPHEGFGEYTVMYPRDTIDPRSSKWNKLYGNDAWTPTEPWVEYEVEDTHKVRTQLEKTLGSDIYHALQASSMLEETNLRDKVQNAEGDVYAALATVPAMKYAYLQSIGKEPKAKTVDDKLDKFYRYNNDQLVAIFNALSDEELQNLQYGDNETNRKIADILNSQFLDTVSNENAKKLFRKKPLWSADGINPNILGDAYRAWQEAGNKIPSVTDGQSLRDELNANKALEKDGTFKKWIKDSFGDIKVNSGLRNNKELFTPSGNRRSFKQLHDEPTLENVVRIMRQEPETGVSMAGTNLVGAATKEYSDVKDMRADSGRLYGARITDDDYQGRMEVFNGRLHDLEVRAAKGDGWEHMDSARQTLLEVMQSAKTEKSMANKLKKEAQWINIDADLASDLWQLKQDVMNMPAPYFEAKPRRVVYNEEAVAFIIPDNAPSELVAELDKQGLNYLTYKAGDETDRLSKVNEVAEKEPSAKFSKEFEEEGNKKAEAKITSGMSDSERADILIKKTIVAPYYTGQADKTIAAESKNLNSAKRSLVTAALARIGTEFNVFTDNGEGYKVSDVEVEVSFSKGALKESAHKAITNSTQLARLLPVLKTAVERAVGVEVHDNRYFFDNNTKQFHELLGGYIDGEYFAPVRFGLKEANDGKATLYIVVCQDKIKKTEVMGAHDMDKTSGQYAPRSVNLNVSRIAEKVNSPDLLRYIPDDFLNESQKKKKYTAIADTIEYTNDKNDKKYAEALEKGHLGDAKMYVKAAAKAAGYTIHAYHGTATEFTVFDKKKIGQNYMQSEGGFFFTDSKRTAENYAAHAGGERVIDAYLKIDNPYVVEAPSARHPIEFFDGHRAEILPEAERKGNDGIIVQNDNGALYIVFESEQVKSAEPITYDDDGAVIPISKRFDSSTPDMRYSREMNESLLEKQNEALKEQLDYYKGQLKRTTEKTARKGDIDKAARTLLKEYDSKLNKEAFAKMLDSIEYYILNNDELRWSDLKEMSTAVAKALVNNAQVLNDEVWEQYRGLIDYLKDAEIILPKREKADMGDYAAFRRKHQGVMKHLKLGDEGNIDMMWMELGEMFGENIFDPTISTQADMLTSLGEFLDRIRPEFENPFDYHYDVAVEAAANAIIDELLSENICQTAPTFADKADAKLKAQKSKDKQKLDALRDEKNAQLESLRKEMQQSKDDALKQLRKERNEKIKAIKQNYADARVRARERRADSAARSRLLNIVKRLQNKKLPAATREELDAMIGDIDTVSKSLTGKTVQKLTDLREWYEEQKENDPDFISDPYIEKKIARLSKKHIADMTAQEVADLTNVLLNIDNELRTKNKLIDSEERREVYNLAVETMSDIESTNGNGGFGTKAENLFINNTLSPVRFIRKITGYHDSNPLYKATQSLADGQRNMLSYQMNAQKPFEKFAQDKAFNKMFAGAKASEIEIAGLSARGIVKVKITPAMRASLYLHSLNDQNLRHIAEGGITVPDIKLYKKGNIAEAYARGTTIKLTPSQVRSIVAKMSAKEKAFAEAAHLYFNSTSKGAINETSEKLKGYSLAQVDNYFPINTDSSFTKKEFDSLKFDGTIEGMGFLKERVNAANPIMLRDANDVVDKSIQMHAKYVGLAIPVRNFSKLLGVNKMSFQPDGKKSSYESSVQKAIKQKWGEFGYDYIEKMMSDLQGNSAKEMNDWAKMFQKVKSNYAGAVLTLNASVAAKQAASYPTAAAVLGWKPLIQAMGNFGKVDLNTIENYTPLQWYRSQGFSTKELGDLKSADRALPPILNWVQGMDVLTTRKLWKASEYYIQNEGKYKVGSDEYYKAVVDIYNRVIEETQPNYTTMQRPQLLRSDDTLMGNLMMFKTQPFQNFNILYDAVENYAAKKKHGNAAEIAEAKRNLNNAVTSQIAQLAVFAGMTFAWAMFRGGKKYKDDDDELTWASFLKAYGKDLMGGLLADVPFGSEAWELMQSYAFGDKYNAPETLVVSAIEDARKGSDALIKAVLETAQNAKDGKPIDYQKLALSVDKAADGISKVFGIPYENVTNLFNACYRWGTIAKQGKYSGEYSALLLTKSKADNKSLYQDVLYKAYDNDLSQYNIVFARMENDGFEPKDMMEKRFKADAKEAVKANDHAAFDDAIKGLVYIGSDADAHKAAQSTIKGMYEDGTSEADAKQLLQSYAGLDSDKAQEVVNRWSYKAANEDSNVSAAGIKNYYEYVKPTGITAENYSEWWEEAKSMKGTDLDHDGKTDKGSVAAQQLEYIDSLPVSNSQKRQLAIAFGMKESTVNKYTGW